MPETRARSWNWSTSRRSLRRCMDYSRFPCRNMQNWRPDLGKGLGAIRCRAAQLRQIVMNLVTNASEAIGDRDGVIRLMTRPATAGRAPEIFKGMTEGDYVELTISDTGDGMPLKIQARVFDPFFTTKSAGRGLGLWVVHGIVRSLGGAIQIVSEPGKGTAVHILLPC